MTKFLFIAMALVTATSAHAANFKCEGLTLSTESGKVIIEGIDGMQGKPAHGELNKKYVPKADHRGSTEYILGDACDESGSVSAILDMNLSSGRNGKLTIENACDTDGGAPTFNSYSCTKE